MVPPRRTLSAGLGAAEAAEGVSASAATAAAPITRDGFMAPHRRAGLNSIQEPRAKSGRAGEAGPARVDRVAKPLGRGAVRPQQLEHLLGVVEPAALAEVDVLLVERHRLRLAAAELAQRLGAREEDAGAIGDLARARELVVGVAVVARLEERAALVEDALGGRGVLGLVAGGLGSAELGERGLGVLLPG